MNRATRARLDYFINVEPGAVLPNVASASQTLSLNSIANSLSLFVYIVALWVGFSIGSAMFS